MALRESNSPEVNEKDYSEVTVTCPYTCEEAPTFVLLDSEFGQVLSCKMKKDNLENIWSSTLVRPLLAKPICCSSFQSRCIVATITSKLTARSATTSDSPSPASTLLFATLLSAALRTPSQNIASKR